MIVDADFRARGPAAGAGAVVNYDELVMADDLWSWTTFHQGAGMARPLTGMSFDDRTGNSRRANAAPGAEPGLSDAHVPPGGAMGRHADFGTGKLLTQAAPDITGRAISMAMLIRPSASQVQTLAGVIEGSKARLQLWLDGLTPTWLVGIQGGSSVEVTAPDIPLNEWSIVIASYRDDTREVKLSAAGERLVSDTSPYTGSNWSAVHGLGARPDNGNNPFEGSVAAHMVWAGDGTDDAGDILATTRLAYLESVCAMFDRMAGRSAII